MEKFYKVVDYIYKEYSYKYSIRNIEDSIMNSIILLVFKKHGIDYDSELNDKIQEMLGNEILSKIEMAIPQHLLVNDHIISNTYEYIIQYRKKDKEKLAVYYTSQWIIDYILDNTLIDYFINDNMENLKILEPSCGSGNFLISIVERLYFYYKENTNLTKREIIYRIINENIYGVDKDNNSLRYCKYSLILKIYKLTGEEYDLNLNLMNLDFLSKGKIDNIKFDFILGNPPYLENRKINKYYQKDYLKKIYQTAVGRFDIYALFIEKSLKILKQKGRVGYIVPSSILANNNFCKLREVILQNCSIEKIINLGDGIFNEVDMSMSMIIMKKTSLKGLIMTKNISHSKYKKEKLYLEPYRKINQNYYNQLLNNVFDINSSDVFFKMRNRIFKESNSKVKDYCNVVAGIATGNVRNKLLTRDQDVNAEKVLEGKNIHRYNHKWNGLYIRTDKSLIDKSKGEYATFMRKDLIYNKKILIRQTADKFICSYDEENYYILNTLYSLIIKDISRKDLSIKFILALLNSSLFSAIYRSITMEDGKLFPQVKIFHIKETPLRIIPYSDQEIIVRIVDEILQVYKEGNISSKGKELYINNKLSQIDHLIYDIYEVGNKERIEIKKIISNT
ncbi:N-6 DNA methylase [Clostridium sp. D2Q-11]|uniref:site-specific DNA-methyltransferase (adenine-specific) n=1 Tax=Anaeromonas frigoriresistens TaxID=2683708 RepID=A0A942UYN0_9FIRM|nr:TaqI-like C-terminal specificity domain-containing protein [Anaeromonas frigoriresistens]MBS4539224.1 N-6 DNA methylase [Anaeromonas frigoriresistens]